jgi:hypothetical protein
MVDHVFSVDGRHMIEVISGALMGTCNSRWFIRIKLEKGFFVIDLGGMAHDKNLAVSGRRWE